MRSKNRTIADIGLSRSIEGATGTDGASGIEMNMLKCVGVQWMRETHTHTQTFNPSTFRMLEHAAV